jgi:hypothetical protein
MAASTHVINNTGGNPRVPSTTPAVRAINARARPGRCRALPAILSSRISTQPPGSARR